MINLIDFELGNIGSVQNMLERLGLEVKKSSSLRDLDNASCIILPGVGSFDAMRSQICESYKVKLQQKVLIDKVPILGICLGMHMLTHSSEEGELPGLSFINARTCRLKAKTPMDKIPNMGWRSISSSNHELFDAIEEPKFYFAHSYAVECLVERDVCASTSFAENQICCAFQSQNVYGVQFHPEKSHKYGFKFFENFFRLVNI